MLLEFMPYRACGPIWQVVHSAAANAQNNYGIEKKNLIIDVAYNIDILMCLILIRTFVILLIRTFDTVFIFRSFY